MDIGYLKIRIDIKTEYEEYKKKYEYKKKELKKEELKKVFEGFKEFFRRDSHFKFKENEHSVAAEYKDNAIKLEMDVYKNIDSPNFNLEGSIFTFEKENFEFVVEAIANRDLTLKPAHADEQERMVHDTRYFQDFLNDDVQYSFVYKIKGREEEYGGMQELMFAL